MPLWKNLQFFTLCLCRDPLSYSPANWNSAWRLNTWPFEMPPLALKGWSWMEFIIPHIHTHLTYQYLQPKIVLLQNPISMSYYLDLISIQHPVCLYITYIICRIISNYHGTIMELPYHWNMPHWNLTPTPRSKQWDSRKSYAGLGANATGAMGWDHNLDVETWKVL